MARRAFAIWVPGTLRWPSRAAMDALRIAAGMLSLGRKANPMDDAMTAIASFPTIVGVYWRCLVGERPVPVRPEAGKRTSSPSWTTGRSSKRSRRSQRRILVRQAAPAPPTSRRRGAGRDWAGSSTTTRGRRAGGFSRTRWLDPILGRETVDPPGHVGIMGAVGHEPRPRAPAARAGVGAVAVVALVVHVPAGPARWGGSTGRTHAPYMCTRPPLVAPHTSPSRRLRTFPFPVRPTRANVDGRRLLAAATKEGPSP